MLARFFRGSAIAATLLASLPAIAATPAVLEADQNPVAPPAGNLGGRGGQLGGFLTPQQQAMYMFEARGQIKDMAPQQRQAFRREQAQKLLAMPEGERTKFKSGLQARWDALPAKQKAQLQARLDNPPPPPKAP